VARDRSFSWWKGLVVGLGVLELAALIYFGAIKNNAPSSSTEVAATPTSEFDLQKFESPAAGFSFDRPRGWDVETAGRTVKVVDPKRRMALAVGPAPSGNVSNALDSLLVLLDSSYRDVRVTNRDVRILDADVAVSAMGSATNLGGEKMGFIVVTTEGTERNYAITAFTAKDKTTDRTTRLVAAVVDSFQEL
jgi:hypothetical protein